MVSTTGEMMRDQLLYAKQGADNLAKASGYMWTDWLHGREGKCTAAFDREGERWSLSFGWVKANGLGDLAKKIEAMDYYMKVCMKEFQALKLGALMRHMEGEPN